MIQRKRAVRYERRTLSISVGINTDEKLSWNFPLNKSTENAKFRLGPLECISIQLSSYMLPANANEPASDFLHLAPTIGFNYRLQNYWERLIYCDCFPMPFNATNHLFFGVSSNRWPTGRENSCPLPFTVLCRIFLVCVNSQSKTSLGFHTGNLMFERMTSLHPILLMLRFIVSH